MGTVIVGVGQLANKDVERLAHPIDLMEDATRLAEADAAANVLAHVGMVLSTPMSVFSDIDGGAVLAERLGLAPGGRVQSGYSGSAPQRLLAQAAQAIENGEIEAALVVGGVAEASIRNARAAGVEPPSPPSATWSQGSALAASPEMDRALSSRYRDMPFMAEGAAGVQAPSAIFALIESALAARAGRPMDEQRVWLGQLMAPFTEVAAARPELAWMPFARTPAELSTVTADNRLIAEPYTKRMCSFPTIDLAAAVLVTSESLADRLGVPMDRRVHPWGITSGTEAGPPSVRADMHRATSLEAAVARVLAHTGVSPAQIAGFDLYSCFPAAVQLALHAFAIDPTDPRPFTRTGGLPYFGGPGASYSLHGMVSVVEHARTAPGSIEAVVGVGGSCHEFSVGLYSTAAPSQPPVLEPTGVVTDELSAAARPIRRTAEGIAVVDAMTVVHDARSGAIAAPVIARLDDGSRVGARPADADLPAALSGTSLVGREVRLSTVGDQTVYTTV